jgi:FkbM family methyltransferase
MPAIKKAIKSIIVKMGLYPLMARLYSQYILNQLARKKGYTLVQKNGKIEITKRRQRRIIISSKHSAYTWDIIIDFERYFDAVVPDKLNEIEVVDYSKPKAHIVVPYGVALNFVSFAENLPMMEQEYFYRYRPKAGDVIFDCGAYCGDMTFVFSRQVGPSGKVYAFEPDPDNYAMLVRNVEIHALKNVFPIKKGIWSSTTILYFNSDGNLGSAISHSLIGSCQIEVISLADAYKEYKLNRLDFIKMDIEGAEIEAVSGSKDFLRSQSLNMAIANHVIDGRHTHDVIERLMAEIGYEAETGNPSGKTNWSDLITWAHKKTPKG